MSNQLRKLAEAEAKNEFHPDRQPFNLYDARRSGYVRGFIAGRTSVTRDNLSEELSKHHFIHGIGRSNSCHCGAQVGEFAEYRNHEANAILAILNGENDD